MKQMIKYRSTRGSNEAITSAQAIIRGIADDGGLYVPEIVPKLGVDLADLIGKDYKDIAFLVLSKFLTDYTDEEIRYCVDKAYDSKFEEPDIVPVVKAGDAWFIELYHGKTAAFKDMALSILPYLLTTALKKENEDKRIAILTATSGDTGKAALEGFADVPGTEIIVFFPKDGVSQVQAMQMITQEGANTHVFGIEGNFDDAQTGVKNIFNDKEISEELGNKGYRLSSANSINIGRLVPQVAYYVWSYVKLLENGIIKKGEKINVTVPTGNFGNILASYYAREMGIPIGKFICASNENKVLTDFIRTGVYDSDRKFYVTSSPSM
ncbi:MAG TPA: threonine synthase, partial [Anaerovoracaceae bacterium]|nr:threonine synthase [Anaerovoracaceae bacterium]